MQLLKAKTHCPVQYSLMKFTMTLEKDSPCEFLRLLQKTSENWSLYCAQSKLELRARDQIPDQCLEILPEDIIQDIHYEETDKPYSHDEYVEYLEKEIYPVRLLSKQEIHSFIQEYKIF